MPRELKVFPGNVKAVNGNEVTGIFSVFGNLDDYNDRLWPGCFTKTLQERAGQFLHLWQHDFSSPPTAVITDIAEVGRDGLPEQVLSKAPDAMGGVSVTRKYLDTERAREVLSAITAGSPLQMSFAYDAIKYDFEELPGAKYEWERLRNIREVRLYETSDVLWGANDATVAAKGLLQLPMDFLMKQIDGQELPLEVLIAQLAKLLKSGARNASTDQARIDQIGTLAIELGATSIKLVDAADEAGKTAQAVALLQKIRGVGTVGKKAASLQDATAAFADVLESLSDLLEIFDPNFDAAAEAAEDDAGKGSRAASALTAHAYRYKLLAAQRRLVLSPRST